MEFTSSPNLILCIDMDGNMIGDIKCQVCEWELVRLLEPTRIRLFRENLKTQLQHSLLIRPGLKHFLTTFAYGDQAELFVYTASDQKWASFLVPILEDVLGIRFHRPILSRSHCYMIQSTGSILKSLVKVANPILKTLRRKYPGITREEIVRRTVLVDNSYVLVQSERHRMIKSWSYNYAYQTDVLRLLSDAVIAQNIKEVLRVLKRYRVHVPSLSSHSTFDDFRVLYYAKLALDMQTGMDAAHKAARDGFWTSLTKTLSSIPVEARYKDKSIRLVQSSLTPSPRHS